ncbi:MAG TPA: DegT/DnrJ/EryC1/StrS family aminotransferase [Baekduia sp.]|nr:DegT/DnrJ/EryC1/StrS family aminotransferase [Baekduia sp.]
MEERALIRFQAPALPPVPEVAAYFAAAEQAHWFSNQGPCVELLVERLEAYIGRGLRCAPLANATSALALALRALTRADGRRREVVLPSFTFAAAVSAVLWAGLQPVFVDVEEASWHLCPDALEAALERDTIAAVLAASTFGSPPPDAIREGWETAAAKAGVPVLVDSAAGFGALTGAGERLGGQGTAEVFSFHATKPFAIGEGGLLVSANGALVERVARLANFGFRAGSVDAEVGLNAKLAEWPAATALAVLDGFEDVLAARRDAATQLLSAVMAHGYRPQAGTGRPAWQFVPVLAPSRAVRDAAIEAAASDGIELRAYFSVPLHRMPAFRGLPVIGSLATTERLAGRVLSLPMANDQTADHRHRIAAALATASSAEAA